MDAGNGFAVCGELKPVYECLCQYVTVYIDERMTMPGFAYMVDGIP